MKKIASFLAFCLVFGLIYWYADSVLMLKPDDGVKLMDDYRGLEPNAVDVISIGSSHVGVNIDPALLWNSCGIAEVNLWSGMQPMWISYYYAKEALRYQHPRLLVVDMYRCADEDDYGEYQYSVKGVQALQPGLDKIHAALTSFEDWKTAAETLWGMPVYHERYNQLTKEDFVYVARERGTLKDAGVHNQHDIYALSMPDYPSILEEEPLTAKNEEYLRKLIKLSKDHGIKLLLVTIPYRANEKEARRANTIARIAQEEGVAYINYLKDLQRTGVDPQKDFYDTGHMNESGVVKFTRIIAEDMRKHADIPDRRDDASYTWFGEGGPALTAPAYRLTEQFIGDGATRYVDTSTALYENPYATWTVLARLKPSEPGKEGVYFSCVSEKSGRIHGLIVKQTADGRLELIWDDDNFTFFDTPVNEDGAFTVAVTKHVDTYAVYLDGKLVFDNIVLPAVAYDGPLLIGARAAESGGKTDFGAGQVCSLELFMELLTPSEISAWAPDPLPMPELPLGFNQSTAELLYAMPEQFVGGGAYRQADYVDTKLKLFDDPGTRFTLLTRITPQYPDGENTVFLSCFAEEADRWRGLLLRAENENTLNLLLGQIYNLPIPYTPGTPIDLCVEKDLNEYTVYINGEKAADRVPIDCDPYDGTLLVGCEITLDGALFRKSSTHVNWLEVYSGILSDEEVQAYRWQDAPMPSELVASSVAYRLPQAYLGDGVEHAIDTGVQLFDVPGKSWSMDFTIMPDYQSYYDIYISCFNEENYAYSGLLVRQEDRGKIVVSVGKLETIEITYGETDKRLHFVIVKSGDAYSVYVNGKLRGQAVSPAPRYDGNLLIGCEQQPDGTFFRYSKVRVLTLNVADEVLSDQEALRISSEALGSGRFD